MRNEKTTNQVRGLTTSNLILDFDPVTRYTMFIKSGDNMRTAEQVIKNLKEAQAEEATAAEKTAKFREELLEIYSAAKSALGIRDTVTR